MTLIIPAAGLSRRFATAGYTVPKAVIPLFRNGSRECAVDRIVESYRRALCDDGEVIVVARSEHLKMFRERVNNRVTFLTVPGLTGGQSETILRALRAINDRPVWICNCDVIPTPQDFEDLEINAALNNAQAVIAVHESRDPRFSYIDRLDPVGRVAEKECISEWAQSGLWWFNSSATLERAIETQLEAGRRVAGEYYLSGALGLYATGMGPAGAARYVLAKPVTGIVDVGTPEACHQAGFQILTEG